MPVGGLIHSQVLPNLRPKQLRGAQLLGAHVEGPYLATSKKGCHDPALFLRPSDETAGDVYGEDNLSSSVKLVTLAPELAGSEALIGRLTRDGIRVSLGHSSASYEQGVEAVRHGATAVTHVYNAMEPCHHRRPGLAGLMSSKEVEPYYSVIADGTHVHEAVVTAAYRANPKRCILITDSVELAGMPDGDYPGHAQVQQTQRKRGGRVTIKDTETLIGGCAGLDECVRNLMSWSGCSVAEGSRCATENVADLMGLEDRGKLVEGRRADFVVLDDEGYVLQTWVGGRRVWQRSGSS